MSEYNLGCFLIPPSLKKKTKGCIKETLHGMPAFLCASEEQKNN